MDEEHKGAKDWLSLSARYHEAAWRVIVASPARLRRLHAPTLHLLGHSMELLLKSVLKWNGAEIPRTHSIADLWSDPMLSNTRKLAKEFAISCAKKAKESKSIDFTEGMLEIEHNQGMLFEALVLSLSNLHSKESDFRLRYPNETNPQVPLPLPFLCVLGALIGHYADEWSIPSLVSYQTLYEIF